MVRSYISATTVGGCDFELLCNGHSDHKSYACDYVIDVAQTPDLASSDALNETTLKLAKHIEDCIKAIEVGKSRKVQQFYVGKTHTHKKKRRERFDRMKFSTWRLSDGVSKRFRKHRSNGYGRDGLVVLTVVTRDAIPSCVVRNKAIVKQELYALALESRLIQHFLIEKDDPRIVNKSFDSGGKDGNKSIGYPLYMAYKLEDPIEESDTD